MQHPCQHVFPKPLSIATLSAIGSIFFVSICILYQPDFSQQTFF